MQNVLRALLLGLLGLASACTRSDESLVSVETPGAANLFLEDVTSERRTFTITESCTLHPPALPLGTTVSIQVIRITARVEWFGTGKCCGTGFQCLGVTPRECQAGNLNAGESCAVNTDCDLNAPDDGLGTCDLHPCQFDSDCTDPDTCGAPAARLVFASDLEDAVTNTEKGVVLFDIGDQDIEFFNSSGSPFTTKIFVKTGDLVRRELTFTREFAVNASVVANYERCLAVNLKPKKITPVILSRNNFEGLKFRIDAIDAISGAARLSSVQSAASFPVEPMCCQGTISGLTIELCNPDPFPVLPGQLPSSKCIFQG